MSLEAAGYVPPASATGGQCLVVWDHESEETMPEDLRAWLRERFDVEVTRELPVVRVTAPYRHTTGRDYHAFYVTLPEGVGQCR